MSLVVVPVEIADARRFVAEVHRHLPALVAGKMAVGVFDGERGELVGVAVAGRPVAPSLDDGSRLEITRCAVREGAPNACSMLYGALRRAGKALGYGVVQTYTRADESGLSLRAAGFVPVERGSGVVRWEVRFVPVAIGTGRVQRERAEARRLWEAGASVREVAALLGCSKSRAHRLIRGEA